MSHESAIVSETPTASTPAAVGIATIANDKVFDWVVPFLESWHKTNRHIPLYLIPYDDNCDKTREACEIYGATFVEPDDDALDALSKRLYPLYPKHRRRLRKFLSLALPLDEVIYVDVDIVLTRNLSVFFGKLVPRECEFIVACPTTDYVYNKRRPNYPFLKDVTLFNDGFFVASNKILSLDHFYEVIAKDEQAFHNVRQRGMLFAQPLTNFVTHHRGLKIKTIPDVVPGGSHETFYKAEGIGFDADGGMIDIEGKPIYLMHWAGAVTLPKRRVVDQAWLKFASEGATRIAAAKASAVRRTGTR